MLRCKIASSSWSSYFLKGFSRSFAADPTPKVAFEKVSDKGEISETIAVPPSSTTDTLEAIRKSETTILNETLRSHSEPALSTNASTITNQTGGASTEPHSLFTEWEENLAKKGTLFPNQFDVTYPGEQTLRQNLSFDEVPGPAVLKYIAQAWSYIPVVGTQLTACAMILALNAGKNLQWSRNVRPFDRLFDRYGPVVRLRGPFGGDLVLLNRPEHMEAVYKQEGRFPVRSSLDCVEHYRKECRRYQSPGPFIICGPDWERLRAKIDNPLQRSAATLHGKIENACEELIARVLRIRNRQEEVPEDFQQELFKWSMESLCAVLFSKRCGFLDPHGVAFNSEQARLLDAMHGATSSIKTCETGLQTWRFYETNAWKSLVSNCDVIDSIISKHIRLAQSSLRAKKERLEGRTADEVPPASIDVITTPGDTPVFFRVFASNAEKSTSEEVHKNKNKIIVDFADLLGALSSSPELPLIETLLLREGMQAEDILTVLLDMVLIGANATTSAISFILYHLSKSQRAQRILFDELCRVMPTRDSRLTPQALQDCPYLKACVMESLRLKPPIPVITRILPKEITLHSYSIPKGTYMLMANQIACLREENFEDAKKFMPERWMRAEERDIHPFATIPFGYGPRNCLGKGTAQRQLWLVTAKLVRNFKIEYHYGDISATTKLFCEPNRSLKFRFVDRD